MAAGLLQNQHLGLSIGCALVTAFEVCRICIVFVHFFPFDGGGDMGSIICGITKMGGLALAGGSLFGWGLVERDLGNIQGCMDLIVCALKGTFIHGSCNGSTLFGADLGVGIVAHD